ncbi:MAG: PIG-L family deacetylase, partial [Verrucomicrobia bacterium]|nr:PIG-L family deacetylase [Verrucomicrobiota bacterium]
MKNPYTSFVAAYLRAVEKGKACPLGGIPPAKRPKLRAKAPKVLIFAPHPDDECIIGALALRLLREAKMNVINVAVTQGSNKERQAARLAELRNACDFLGFGLLTTRENGLEKISPKGREQNPANWAASVDIIARILAEQQPRVVFMPHAQDLNGTHIGTNLLVTEAMAKLGPTFSCLVVETEFWAAMTTPNMMVESNARDVADMVAATSFHVGEVQRNPYHLGQPAWMQDNVRRGAEIVGG